MAIIKCKMCGGDLILTQGQSVAECEFCGSRQTVPVADNEKKLTLFARANRLRAACEFDKAAGIYESIVADFPEEAEAYWGLVLCKYGIEYVDDPGTGKKIPTCHRSSFDSIMEDGDFEQALENADVMARKVYRDEAKQIEEIRKGIIAVSANEEPYDIFICYKETDVNGDRTLDSVLAQDIYDALTDKGYRVFFARITLEDKLGQEYEPYIFAALNSAKIMLAVGTDYEYYNAVWVKNEWSRYLKLMEKDRNKHLIPCFKGIGAYDMPKEFAKLQAQDLGKVGAVQDLLRGIEKLISPKDTERIAVTTSIDIVEDTLKRAYSYLNTEDWTSAQKCLNTVLGYDPHNVTALIGCLMKKMQVSQECKLADCNSILANDEYYMQAIRFADAKTKAQLEEYNCSSIYHFALEQSKSPRGIAVAIKALESISGWGSADEQIAILKEKQRKTRKLWLCMSSVITVVVVLAVIAASFAGKEIAYRKGVSELMTANNSITLNAVIENLKDIADYKDAQHYIYEAKYKIGDLEYSEMKYAEALSIFIELKDAGYQPGIDRLAVIEQEIYSKGKQEYDRTNWGTAKEFFEILRETDYSDSIALFDKCTENIKKEYSKYNGIWREATDFWTDLKIDDTGVYFASSDEDQRRGEWERIDSYTYDEDSEKLSFVFWNGDAYDVQVSGNCLTLKRTNAVDQWDTGWFDSHNIFYRE